MSGDANGAPAVAPVWWVITHLGSSSLLLPAFLLLVWSFWRSGLTEAARHYALAMAGAVLLTVVSKCLFYGWGIGIATLDFTGISGHGLLAGAVLPVLLRGLPGNTAWRWGPGLGVGFALCVGVSRVMVGAHSVSEVFAAWLLGLAVSWPVVQRLHTLKVAHWGTRWAPLLLVLALNTSTATYLPTHALEVRVALWLSGQVQPFNRHQLHQAPAAPSRTPVPL